ncbi:MAG: histidine--tRNA ligase [Deltaproteobacteria bacterium]|nr:histidine--tRNA ligase [Deltaproteobacteria bacterium]
MAKITAIRGFKDILPQESGKWHYVERIARQVFANYGIHEIKIPLLEKTELFKRGIGETTDIVEKEMYTFLDKGDEYLTLRPEATASVIRAYLEHNMNTADPLTKLFTIGPMFRRERPQKGRFRQFNQINVEFIGQKDPRVDSELISMLMHFLTKLGLSGLSLEINSLGCPECRPDFRENVRKLLRDREDELCSDCKRRLETNPLRIFDCKNERCQALIREVPTILEYICSDCGRHFESVKKYLELLGVAYKINTRMVRGLDYYTQTAFEITTESLGAQNAIAGGGRYDGLTRILGGPDIPGIGFAIGLERLISLVPGDNEDFTLSPHIFIAALGEKAQEFSFSLCNALRKAGIRAEMDFSDKGLKSQMKRSDKLNCLQTLIIGERECEDRQAPLRNMVTKEQEIIDIGTIDGAVKAIIDGSRNKK